MLVLSLSQDDYFTIDDDIVIRVSNITSNRCSLGIKADPSIPIVRGAVRERSGEVRPECVSNPPRKKHRYRKDALFYWNSSREKAVKVLERLADHLEEKGSSEEARLLRVQLDQLIPNFWEDDVRAD